MKKQKPFKLSLIHALLLAGLGAGAAGTAQAQIVLGHHYRPHYWDLPNQFDNAFVFPGQTFLYNSTRKTYDNHGNKVDTGVDTDTLFGFTIIPYFFKFDKSSDWAYAFSMNTYEFRTSSGGASVQGVGSLIPAFTGWTKPTANSTLGYDILIATPLRDVRDQPIAEGSARDAGDALSTQEGWIADDAVEAAALTREHFRKLQRPMEGSPRRLVSGQIGRERSDRSPAHRGEHFAVAIDGLPGLDGQ